MRHALSSRGWSRARAPWLGAALIASCGGSGDGAGSATPGADATAHFVDGYGLVASKALAVDATGAVFDGAFAAKSYTGAREFHLPLFNGSIDPPLAVQSTTWSAIKQMMRAR